MQWPLISQLQAVFPKGTIFLLWIKLHAQLFILLKGLQTVELLKTWEKSTKILSTYYFDHRSNGQTSRGHGLGPERGREQLGQDGVQPREGEQQLDEEASGDIYKNLNEVLHFEKRKKEVPPG
jgi:hypothetical protein